MNEAEKPVSPAQDLAHKILIRLVEKNLLDKEAAMKIENAVAEGKMLSADWKLVFEKSLGLHKQS